MSYSKEDIFNIISDKIDAIYLTNVLEDTYETLQDNEFFHEYFGDEGTFHVLMSCFLTGKFSKEVMAQDAYHPRFEKPNGYKNKLANQFRVHIDDKEYSISMINYPLDDTYSVLFFNVLSVGEYMQSAKAEDKAQAVNNSYLFSMNVDLLADSCSNMFMSEVEDNSVGGMDISYIDWRKSIVPMFFGESQKTFLEYTDPEFLKANLKYKRTKSVDCQMANLAGEIIWVKLIFNRIDTGDDSEFRFVFMIEDINESRNILAEEMKTYEDMATRDSLTGLLNHGSIEKLLKNSLVANNEALISLIMFDIDHFKNVNDTFGHATGDQVLKTFATIGGDLLKNYGGQLGRWGGEEFLALIPNQDADKAFEIAEELRKLIENYEFETVNHITSSFGVHEIKNHESADEAFNAIDLNLYKAKTSGRNLVVKD